MALMSWNKKHSVGVEALDNQHKTLVDILNELHAASIQGRVQEVAGALIRKLVTLAGEHFAAEEKLMESIQFPGLANHRARHKELTGKVAEFVTRQQKGDKTVYTQLLYFVRDWLTKHMQNEDQEYAAYLRSHPLR